MKPHAYFLADEAQSECFGELLGGLLLAGDCVALIGELGTGKTSISRGIGRGLKCSTPLRSPTYLLCQEHEGRHPVLHLDAYFEARMDSLLGEGLCERFDQEHVVLVEWADRLEQWWPADRLEIRLIVEKSGRLLQLMGLGPRSEALRKDLKNSWEKVQKA
ncbi:MAG: tRNA (adenosine(37)-N6)-threonylcarbamoyltransferase complex ATPase subunit type 1 TsaE [Planctomycetota bacterium]|nr:tRNA (adenosine(37)-N6)-threonylcarbamoyltransferase complex ATPase subunit type 1 TsaE [Planctomycetota bacterium]MDA1114167.1 tRNA (adenosine(37)-N6)-threonylcarbamoyltransferase complex ATPase subunit type 1 TsaE [Planctomycetota bacterium]